MLVRLYADDQLWVVNKPNGLASLPHSGPEPHLVQQLQALEPGFWAVLTPLDRAASGAVLVARTPQAQRALQQAQEQGQVQVVFHALVLGNPAWDRRELDTPLRPNVGRRKRTVADPARGRPARTRVRVIERFGSHALVEVTPLTRVRHQVRAHLYAAGHPIAGDPLYGPGPEPGGVARHLALHARRLRFPHPGRGETMQVTAPYPAWWDAALDALRWEKALTRRDA